MESSPEKSSQDPSNETIAFSGRLGEIVHIEQPDGRIFEQFRRPPGTRIVIVSDDEKILITKEFRHESGNVDLRLPGGKVCDSLEEYHKLLQGGKDIAEKAIDGAKKEALEETGLVIDNLELITKANAGASVGWDLYYFLAREHTEHPEGQKLEIGENIECVWMTPSEIREAIQSGQMQEWRSAGVLLGKVLPMLEQAQSKES